MPDAVRYRQIAPRPVDAAPIPEQQMAETTLGVALGAAGMDDELLEQAGGELGAAAVTVVLEALDDLLRQIDAAVHGAEAPVSAPISPKRTRSMPLVPASS